MEKVLVKAGQKVKKNAPLAELFSGDLASAKNAYLSKLTISQNSERLSNLRKKLVETGAISQQLWVDTQNDNERSGLDLRLARDLLAIYYRLSQHEIDALNKDQDSETKARFVLRSPVDGTVLQVEARPQDLADPKTLLMTIRAANP